MVYVLDIEGKPLMPTVRYGKVRRLLRDGLAHVVRLQPFTIQLDYESTTYRQEVSLGIDAGSVHIGGYRWKVRHANSIRQCKRSEF